MGDRHTRMVVREVAAVEDGADTNARSGEVIDNEVVLDDVPLAAEQPNAACSPPQLDGVTDERVELRSFGIAL